MVIELEYWEIDYLYRYWLVEESVGVGVSGALLWHDFSGELYIVGWKIEILPTLFVSNSNPKFQNEHVWRSLNIKKEVLFLDKVVSLELSWKFQTKLRWCKRILSQLGDEALDLDQQNNSI